MHLGISQEEEEPATDQDLSGGGGGAHEGPGVWLAKMEHRHPCLSTLPVKAFPHKKGSQGMEDGQLRTEELAITCDEWEMELDNCITKNIVLFKQ